MRLEKIYTKEEILFITKNQIPETSLHNPHGHKSTKTQEVCHESTLQVGQMIQGDPNQSLLIQMAITF